MILEQALKCCRNRVLWSTMTTGQWLVNVISPTLNQPRHPQILQQKLIPVTSDFLSPTTFFVWQKQGRWWQDLLYNCASHTDLDSMWRRLNTDTRRVCLIKPSPPPRLPCPSKHNTQRWFDVGPQSTALAQHLINAGLIACVCWGISVLRQRPRPR